MSRPRSPRCRLLLQSPSLASVPGPLLRLEWPSVVGGVGRGSFCCLLWPFSCPSTVGCEERVTGQMAAAAGRASAGQPGRCSVRVGPGRGAGSCPRSFAPDRVGSAGPWRVRASGPIGRPVAPSPPPAPGARPARCSGARGLWAGVGESPPQEQRLSRVHGRGACVLQFLSSASRG